MSEAAVDERTDAWQNHFDWPVWLQRWDTQQTGYLPDREQRF